MGKKIVIAVTGASGSVYADVLLKKLMQLKEQWNELSLVMTENAREVWRIELDNDTYNHYQLRHFTQQDFDAPFAS